MRRRAAHVDVLGQADRLAVVQRLELGELLIVVFDRLRERMHQLLAPARRHARPRALLQRRARRGDRALHILGPGLCDRRDLSPAGRIERGERGTVGSVEALLADQQPLGAREELACGGSERIGQCGGCVGGGCHGGSL